MELTYTLSNINDAAKAVYEYGKKYPVWIFEAPMGSGKTTFISALCKMLGVKDEPSSPTYSIINEYKLPDGKSIVHMDWYRLKDEQEALGAGVDEYFNESYFCLIEWPQNAKKLLPEKRLVINIFALDENTRQLKIHHA